MGNQQNASVCHVENIARSGSYNVLSSSLEAFENDFVKPSHYSVIDMAFGMQKDDGHSLVHYKTFSSTLQKQVMAFIRGGGRMFVSGAYIGSDMQRGDERDFLSGVFKTSYGGSDCNQTNNTAVSYTHLTLPTN